jgi:hypothetical protein
MRNIFLLICLLYAGTGIAQSSFTVTDSDPVNANGLSIGYHLVSEKEKEVGNKGDFSRFSVEFYVTNTGSEAKIILYRQGLNLLGSDVSPNLVLFKCLNATGARLTSKELTLQAKPCILQGIVEEKDGASGKTVENRRPVKIGYWIKPGETISARTIMIVPLNDKPQVVAFLFPDPGAPVATTMSAGAYNNYNNNNPGMPASLPQGFVKIKSITSGDYLNEEHVPIGCTPIEDGWWSAQWQLLPVSGTNYYIIQNRWKSNFLSIDDFSLLSSNSQSRNALWLLETVDGGRSYTIKNASRNAAITNLNGVVQANPLERGQQNTKWIIEPYSN